MLKGKLQALIAGALLTGLLMSLYVALNFEIPVAGGIESESAGWQFSAEYFVKAFPLLLVLSLAIFLTLVPLGYRLLKKLELLNCWSVAVISIALGFFNPFLHLMESLIPYREVIFLLGLISLPAGVLLSYTQLGRLESRHD